MAEICIHQRVTEVDANESVLRLECAPFAPCANYKSGLDTFDILTSEHAGWEGAQLLKHAVSTPGWKRLLNPPSQPRTHLEASHVPPSAC